MKRKRLVKALRLRARTDGWTVNGRAIRLSEMELLRELVRYEREQRIESDGCCCDGPWSTGKCRYFPGLCKQVETAAAMLRRSRKDGQ